jgi:4'-phosphopantetheinyl transferase
MQRLDSGHIHLWLAWLGKITDPRKLAEYRSLLSEEERQRQMRFHFERDRHRYLVTRAMVRTVLSRYADVAPRDWRFAVNDYGKPSIVPEHSLARSIEFNLSHTAGLVVLAVACDRVLGVDVENVRAREIDIEVADRFFAAVEVAALRATPSEEQQQRFFDFWTLKESYIKARGLGLSIPLASFAFCIENPGQVQLTTDQSLHGGPERWVFWRLRFGPDHLVALCAQDDEARRPLLECTRYWP